MEKQNLTQQKHSSIKTNVLKHKINTKKLKPGIVASYDIHPGNGEGLFLFWCFINLPLTYLDTYPLTALDPHGAKEGFVHKYGVKQKATCNSDMLLMLLLLLHYYYCSYYYYYCCCCCYHYYRFY